MVRNQAKKLFWSIAHAIEQCNDTQIYNANRELEGLGIAMSEDCYVIYEPENATIKICNKDFETISFITEEILPVIDELLEAIEIWR